MKPLVYVAGPVTANPWGCVRQGTDAWAMLRRLGLVPFLPQLSVLHEIVDPQPYDEWLAYDLDLLAHCQGLVRLHGASNGADAEVAEAIRLGLPTLHAHPDGLDHNTVNDLAIFADRCRRPVLGCGGVKALTVQQPWASLIAHGHKTIETRPAPPNGPMRPAGVRGLPGLTIERGERIAIHAGATKPPSTQWEDAPFDDIEDRFQYGQHSEGDRSWWLIDLDPQSPVDMVEMPLGAVVATAVVADALPITKCSDAAPHICTEFGEAVLLHSPLDEPWSDGETEHDVSDESPLGDFTPGRWGWLLTDVQRIDPVPCKGRQGVWALPDDVAEVVRRG